MSNLSDRRTATARVPRAHLARVANPPPQYQEGAWPQEPIVTLQRHIDAQLDALEEHGDQQHALALAKVAALHELADARFAETQRTFEERLNLLRLGLEHLGRDVRERELAAEAGHDKVHALVALAQEKFEKTSLEWREQANGLRAQLQDERSTFANRKELADQIAAVTALIERGEAEQERFGNGNGERIAKNERDLVTLHVQVASLSTLQSDVRLLRENWATLPEQFGQVKGLASTVQGLRDAQQNALGAQRVTSFVTSAGVSLAIGFVIFLLNHFAAAH